MAGWLGFLIAASTTSSLDTLRTETGFRCRGRAGHTNVARFTQFQTATLSPAVDQRPMSRARPFEVGIEAALHAQRINGPFGKMVLTADRSIAEDTASVHTGVLLVTIGMDFAKVMSLPPNDIRRFAGEMAHRATDVAVREVGWDDADAFHELVTVVAHHQGPYEETLARTRDARRRLLHVTRSEVDEDGARVVVDSLAPDGSIAGRMVIWSRGTPDRPRWGFPVDTCKLVGDVLEYRDREGTLLARVDPTKESPRDR